MITSSPLFASLASSSTVNQVSTQQKYQPALSAQPKDLITFSGNQFDKEAILNALVEADLTQGMQQAKIMLEQNSLQNGIPEQEIQELWENTFVPAYEEAKSDLSALYSEKLSLDELQFVYDLKAQPSLTTFNNALTAVGFHSAAMLMAEFSEIIGDHQHAAEQTAKVDEVLQSVTLEQKEMARQLLNTPRLIKEITMPFHQFIKAELPYLTLLETTALEESGLLVRLEETAMDNAAQILASLLTEEELQKCIEGRKKLKELPKPNEELMQKLKVVSQGKETIMTNFMINTMGKLL